jgi:phenylacetate-coenzyme A ligase PaaK-like adenylate-forming protein
LNSTVKNNGKEHKIFSANADNFLPMALEVFNRQYTHNPVYRQYCQLVHCKPDDVHTLESIPFLPISFFKSHMVKTGSYEAEQCFESSGTTQTTPSRHYVKDAALYRQSFETAFEKFYGQPQNWCIIGLLPSYIEKGNSSLVYMADQLIKKSNHPLSNFYLYDVEKLYKTLIHNEILKHPTLLLGVTYALLDFATAYPMQLRNTIIMETGGMKGRKEELTRMQVHKTLQQQLGVDVIHAEYGMTELMSQAYSKGNGFFHCPPWMKVLLRSDDDPFSTTLPPAKDAAAKDGLINVIDLANIHSCSFIATEDRGRLYPGGIFEVLGRADNSEIRGCSLLAV